MSYVGRRPSPNSEIPSLTRSALEGLQTPLKRGVIRAFRLALQGAWVHMLLLTEFKCLSASRHFVPRCDDALEFKEQ